MKRDELLICAGAAEGVPPGKGRKCYVQLVESFIRFCQENKLMRRVLLKPGQKVTGMTMIMRSDLTPKGHRFYREAYDRWERAATRGKLNPKDTSFMAEELAKLGSKKSSSAKTKSSLSTSGAKKNHRKPRSSKRRQPDDVMELDAEDDDELESSGSKVYDKADWHVEGDYPDDLPEEQACLYTGLFLGWLIENEMLTREFRKGAGPFLRRRLTGPKLYDRWGGVLASDMLSEAGNQFTVAYYESGKYLHDYEKLLARRLPSPYHVTDTWKNYEIIKQKISKRFQSWKRSAR